MTEESLYFVRVSDPVSVKRKLLEVNKELLIAMSKYERFKQLRRQRQEAVGNLKELCNEINSLMTKLRQCMPKLSTSLGDEKLQRKIKKMHSPPKPRAETELDKIERKIKDLEQRMEKLG